MMHRSSLALALAAGLAACDAGDGPETFVLRFAPVFGDQPFACGQRYAGVGAGGSEVEVRDFRLYVHAVQLIRDDGERVPLTLEQDGRWQREDLALLDFEDSTGACKTGSAEMNAELRGTAPAGTYTGVAFTVGVPEAMNHLDAATAPAPLNAQGLWWSWAGGFKYVKLELLPAGQAEYFFHLGATACDGTPSAGFACAYGNRAEVVVEGLDLATDAITVDAAAVFAGVDVDRVPDGMTDTLPGCMAFPGDPECPAMLAPFGLSYQSDAPSGAQTVFRARAGAGEP